MHSEGGCCFSYENLWHSDSLWVQAHKSGLFCISLSPPSFPHFKRIILEAGKWARISSQFLAVVDSFLEFLYLLSTLDHIHWPVVFNQCLNAVSLGPKWYFFCLVG